MSKYMRSPIFYMGNKTKLLKDIIPLMPNNINKFYDLFGGSGVVSLNVKSKEVFLNEKNIRIFELYKMFREFDAFEIEEKILKNINEFGLVKGKGGKKNKDDNYEIYQKNAKECYFNFRKHFNENNKDIRDLFTLSFYCNNNNIRFNQKGEFNMPIGNQKYTNEKHFPLIENACEKFNKRKNFNLFNCDFTKFENESFSNDDFVYCDPPYLNTTAVYNEKRANGGWNIEHDYKLFEMLENLDKRGINWGLSNVFENKGIKNEHLIKWCNDNNWFVHHLNHKYSACGKGNSNNDEVYITNYQKKDIQRNLFNM